MRLKSLSAKNFRTLEECDLCFESHYVAVCGKNNSGKSNIIRAIRFLLGTGERFYYARTPTAEYQADRTAWRARSKSDSSPGDPIELEAVLHLDHSNDEGIIQFLDKLLASENPSGGSFQQDRELKLGLTVQHGKAQAYSAAVDNVPVESVTAGEIASRLQRSRSVIYHNSVSSERHYYRHGAISGALDLLPVERKEKLEKKQAAFTREMKRAVEHHRQELASLIGRLEEKYKLELDVPELSLGQMPITISLGDKKFSVPLDDWGSGTQNRTLILRTLFDSKSSLETSNTAERTVPIVLIEEPESFLHPLAQAQFGNVLQDLAQELGVQVITTTHSPYMLNHHNPRANVLLDREVSYGSLRGTKRISTDDDDWKRPFEHALGVVGPEFDTFKEALFASSNMILLVEGESDAEYLEMCRDDRHGDKKLLFTGDIFPYGGKGSLQNTVLLNFIKNRFNRTIITFDLDAKSDVESKLKHLGLKPDVDYFAVGQDKPGKRAIEGLLPDTMIQEVTANHPELVAALQSDDKEEAKQARTALKKLYLTEFRANSTPGEEWYGGLYGLCAKINKSAAGATKKA